MRFEVTKLFALVLLLSLSIRLSLASDTISLAGEDSWPPFAKEDGTGASYELILQALSHSVYRIEFVTVPYARALLMTENGQTDGAFNVTKQASTIEKFVFGEEPLFSVAAHYFYPPNKSQDYTKPSDIPKGTSVGVIIGYEYGDEYESVRMNFEEVKVSSQRQLIYLLTREKIDMAIMFDSVAMYTLAEMGLDYDTIARGNINHTSDIYVAFSKKASGLKEKIGALDKGLKQIKNSEGAEKSSSELK